MPPFIDHMVLDGFLSFQPGTPPVPLRGLNLLIGPNGAGKSNFVEAFAVLRATARDLSRPIRDSGGARDWLWRGELPAERAKLEITLGKGQIAPQESALRYMLVFGAQGDAFVVLDEELGEAEARPDGKRREFYYGYGRGQPTIKVPEGRRELRIAAGNRPWHTDIDPTKSILSQRQDPDTYPEITTLGRELGRIRIYRNWSFGPNAPVRASCGVDVETDALSESFDNLPARLMSLRKNSQVKKQLRERLQELSPGFEDVEVVLEGGRLQIVLQEVARNTPARRLSDGTLRYLCLLAILLDPEPPPLVVIEEPELGLHPDMFPGLRDLLLEASERTQLVVTTHSTALVDAFSDHPDAILVCDRVEGATRLRRLQAEEADDWRRFGGLAKLWMSGHLGGTRW
jgi:predicted ATPase